VRAGNGTKLGLIGAGGVAGYAWLANTEESRRSIEWVWTFFLRVIENGPIGVWAVLLAILAGWLVTLRVSMFPMHCLSAQTGAAVAQLAGAIASFTVVWWLWSEPLGLIVGAIIGLSAPYTWALVLILLELCPGAWAQRWADELRGQGPQMELFRRRP
jgi:hypothetical protein